MTTKEIWEFIRQDEFLKKNIRIEGDSIIIDSSISNSINTSLNFVEENWKRKYIPDEWKRLIINIDSHKVNGENWWKSYIEYNINIRSEKITDSVISTW